MKHIVELITPQLKNTIVCQNGITRDPSTDHSQTITLPLDRGTSIQTLIDSFQLPETLVSPNNMIVGCGTDGKHGVLKGLATTKQMVITASNNLKYAILSLKRFKQNADGTNTKIDTAITPDKDITIDGKKFQLKGIVCHSGGTRGGHYWYILCKNGDPIIELNDKSVTPLTDPTAELKKLETFGYIYLYERVKVIGGSRSTRKQSRPRGRAPKRRFSRSSPKTSVSGKV